VPRAVRLVSSYILHITKHPELQRRPLMLDMRQHITASQALS
jgi:hypothetical protein